MALLHIAPRVGDPAFNRRLIEHAIVRAAGDGAEWVVTPELAVCGYAFEPVIGTDWIFVQPDPWMTAISNLAARLEIAVFLSVPERDAASNRLYDTTLSSIEPARLAASIVKVNALQVDSVAWSAPGAAVRPIAVGARSVRVMICADAYTRGSETARCIRGSASGFACRMPAWFHGPQGEREQATSDKGLPLFVCDRTGQDAILDFSPGESVLADVI